ncbi:hypothetical protein INT43_007020 [Umbelopsis isabellina]|uniref:Ribosomal silencing factor RsfS n=1 Tax=Mortierella isabellina TaxID=91625 RepID=A0A8H7UJH7_MORIS|nr:hypothetical protein INT43_007020 [Umbelopsis isabellina]
MFLLRRSALNLKAVITPVRPSTKLSQHLTFSRIPANLVAPLPSRRWLTSGTKDSKESLVEHETEEEKLSPEDLAAFEAELSSSSEKDEADDQDWFVDADYEQDNAGLHQSDFIPLWQRRATGEVAASTAAANMIKDKKVKLSSVLALLEESKAENVSVIDMRSKCDWTDFMIVAESSRGERFLNSIADELVGVLGKAQKSDPSMSSLPKPNVEGQKEGSDWLLVDAGPFIIHLFTPEARVQYDLENLWANVPDDPLLRVESKGLNADQLKDEVEQSIGKPVIN